MLCHISILFLLILPIYGQQAFFPHEMGNKLPFPYSTGIFPQSSIAGKDTSTSAEDRVTGRKLGELIHDMSKELYLTINNPLQFQKEYLPSNHLQLPNQLDQPYPLGLLSPSSYFSRMGPPFIPTGNFPYGLYPSAPQTSFGSFQPSPFLIHPPFPMF